MSHLLSGIEPVDLWNHFYQLTRIPHPSGGEEAICRYVYRLAESLGLEVSMDQAGGDGFGNVLVKCPPSPGCEGAPTTIFQSHLDMVALPEENKGRPLALVLDGTVLRALGNTLGADNGIAVAMALTLMTAPVSAGPKIVHGPLELLFTIDEEAGMTGVRGLSDRVLEGRFLINVDSQEEETLTVGCAGASLSIFRLPVKMERAPKGSAAVRVSVSGGKGGHSGLQIHCGRANAGQLLVRILYEESKAIPLYLSDVSWGTVENAIPSEAQAVVQFEREKLSGLKEALQKWDKVLEEEFGRSDGDLRIGVEEIPCPDCVMNSAMTAKAFSFLLAFPHGVQTMSAEVEDLVETSANVAVVRTSAAELTVRVSQRSMVDPALDAIITKCEAVACLADAGFSHVGKAYGWKPKMDSPLLAICREAYQQVYGQAPRIRGLHGMLECGLIKSKYPHSDMISLGPTIRDAHAATKADFIPGVDSDSTGERIDTARMSLCWEFIKTILKKLAERRPEGLK